METRAARGGSFACVQILLDHGVSVDATDGGGLTALAAAARQGETHMVTQLLAAGAAVDATVKCGPLARWTPLLFAAQAKCNCDRPGTGEYASTLVALLQAGANPNQADCNGFSCLMCEQFPLVATLLLDLFD